jgi:hypothetical protein
MKGNAADGALPEESRASRARAPCRDDYVLCSSDGLWLSAFNWDLHSHQLDHQFAGPIHEALATTSSTCLQTPVRQ